MSVKKNKFLIFPALLLGVALAGCKTDNPQNHEQSECSVFIVEAESVNNTRFVEMDDSAVEVKFTVQLSEALAAAAVINLTGSATELDRYNSDNGTSYAMLPDGSYSFKTGNGPANPEVTVAAGNTGVMVTLAIDRFDPESGTPVYLLPVCIADAASDAAAMVKSVKPYYVAVRFELPDPPFVHPTSGRIPVLRISTGAANYDPNRIKKDTYINATITIENPDGLYSSAASEPIATEIKGRGNTTWGFDKKPYKLKLNKKQRLLGMSDNKHFVLLANHNDKTLLRNSVAFKLSEVAGMMWSPRWVPVELYVDNTFRGQYMLTEHVRTGEERIEMEVGENGEEKGGFLFCIDYKDQEEGAAGWLQLPSESGANNRMFFAFNEPEAPTQQQITWAKNYVGKVQTEIYKATTMTTGYCDALAGLIDVSSFIQYFFVQEVTKNIDGNMRLSTPVALPAGGKLFFPCVWDFDLAIGLANYHSSEQAGANSTYQGWYIRNSQWLRVMFKNDEFCNRVKSEWVELYPKLIDLEPEFRAWAALIDDAQKRNFTSSLWGTVNYANEVNSMIKFYRDRVEWMNTEITAGRHKYTGPLN